MISLDITNTNLYAVVGKYKSGLITITSANALPLPSYVNTDGSGDKTALSESIKTILADTREKRVNIQFSDSTTISHQYEFPYEKKPANMRSIVQGGLTQNTQDYVMDYVILDIFEKEGSPFCTVQVYLTPRPLVEFAQDIIIAAGKKPASFRIAENCMYLLQHTGGGFGGRDVILANMGSAQVKVMLLTELSKILMRSASVMSEYEAFSNVSSKLYDKNPLINETIEQVSKMIQYQSIKQPGERVDHIFLFGEYASPENAQVISAALNTEITILPQPSFVTAPAGFPFEKYASAVGALIEA